MAFSTNPDALAYYWHLTPCDYIEATNSSLVHHNALNISLDALRNIWNTVPATPPTQLSAPIPPITTLSCSETEVSDADSWTLVASSGGSDVSNASFLSTSVVEDLQTEWTHDKFVYLLSCIFQTCTTLTDYVVDPPLEDYTPSERTSLAQGLLSDPTLVDNSVLYLNILVALASAEGATLHCVRRLILGMVSYSNEMWMQRLEALQTSAQVSPSDWGLECKMELFLLEEGRNALVVWVGFIERALSASVDEKEQWRGCMEMLLRFLEGLLRMCGVIGKKSTSTKCTFVVLVKLRYICAFSYCSNLHQLLTPTCHLISTALKVLCIGISKLVLQCLVVKFVKS
jgi:hypothetical protein